MKHIRGKSLNDRYLEWIMDHVCDEEVTHKYSAVIAYLYATRFTWLGQADADRAADGVNLRYDFADDAHIDPREIAYYVDDRPCSMLEMMAALAIRCERDIMFDIEFGDRTHVWFMAMLHSMGLDQLDDEHFNPKLANAKVTRCLNRTYSSNGRGGLFYIPHTNVNMRNLDIWYQMQEFLNYV